MYVYIHGFLDMVVHFFIIWEASSLSYGTYRFIFPTLMRTTSRQFRSFLMLSTLLSRFIEKKTEITISKVTIIVSQLKVTPVRLPSGIIMIRSESEQVLNLLNKMNIPYPEKIINGARTKKT